MENEKEKAEEKGNFVLFEKAEISIVVKCRFTSNKRNSALLLFRLFE